MTDKPGTADMMMRMQNPVPKTITISARLYEEMKDYLAMETDMTAGQLLRRLRESNNG